MHFSCTCGHRISNTTDHLPYAAHLIADVDAKDYWEAWERRGRGQALGSLSDPFDYEKEIYQCEECGRVWFEHPDEPWRFIAFAPEGDNVMVTGPAEGKNWKGYIYGFSDLGMERGIGSCFTNWNYGTGKEYKNFSTYDDMRTYFDAKVSELKEAGLLSSAWVNKDGETVYRWNLEEELPVQKKHELYLTDEESESFAEFESEHADCHRKYPRGPRGWNFAYEILPGVCGADDRDLRVTCLRCGAYAESVDGKLSRHAGASKGGVKEGGLTGAILDLIHERATRDVRSETISQPGRSCDISEAIGYMKGLVDAARLVDSDTPLPQLFQRVLGELSENDSYTSQVRNLIRSAAEDGPFDWTIEDALPTLLRVMKADFPNLRPAWIDETPKVRNDHNEDPEEVLRAVQELRRTELAACFGEDDEGVDGV